MNVKLQYIVTAILILMVCVGSSPADTHTWVNNRTGDWFTAVNWNEGFVPVAGDDVAITNTGAYVILSGSTEPNLSSLTLSPVETAEGQPFAVPKQSSGYEGRVPAKTNEVLYGGLGSCAWL